VSPAGPRPADRLNVLLDTGVTAGGVAGIAVVTKDSGAPAVAAWRPRDLDREPACLIYSVTKTFTATLILLLCEDGLMRLEDSVSRWMPAIPRAGEITVRHLLSHTSGIPDYGTLAAYHAAVRRSPGTPWTFEEFAAATYETGLVFAPGTGWAYSNPGYMLLKRIAEAAAATPYAQLVQDRIVRPLGLARTRVVESVQDLRDLAPGPSHLVGIGGERRDIRDVYHPGWVAHGVLASTASEVAIFLTSVLGHWLLSPQSVEHMTRGTDVPGAPPPWSRPVYGLGLMGDPDSALGPLWGHNGSGPGYEASVFATIAPGGKPRVAAAICAMEGTSTAEILVRQALALR
jgi:D-alanyl-D-alanine carboxypeptidase